VEKPGAASGRFITISCRIAFGGRATGANRGAQVNGEFPTA
jgi:hypothetical protein